MELIVLSYLELTASTARRGHALFCESLSISRFAHSSEIDH